MRPIKFRAWNRHTQTVIDLYKITPLALADGVTGGLYLPLHVEDYIIEQFTGLLDKNGREIYEGDIVSAEAVDQNTVFTQLVVRWQGNGWMLGLGEGYYRTFHSVENIEVIGNVHQNAELVK